MTGDEVRQVFEAMVPQEEVGRLRKVYRVGSVGRGAPVQYYFSPARGCDSRNLTISELESTEAMPDPFYGQFLEAFISPLYRYDPVMDELYGCTAPYGVGDVFTHHVDQQTKQTPQLGSALSLSARLIVQRLADLHNFNLDCDRGYG